MKSWDDEIADVVKSYKDGDKEVMRRRSLWPSAVQNVLLPTLQEARDLLNKAGFGSAERVRVEHLKLGTGRDNEEPGIETVQLFTGQSDLLGFIDVLKEPSSGLVMEVGATLGYGLGINGRVLRWHTNHWLSGFSNSSPEGMLPDETYEDPSVLTAKEVRDNVVEFLRLALKTSYRGSDRTKERMGFYVPQFVDPGTKKKAG